MSGLAADPTLRRSSFPIWPIWAKQEQDALSEVLSSGVWAGSRARYLPAFSEAFAQFQDCSYAIPMGNGSLTLEAALAACGVGEGDEVIVPALTFVATASAVLRVNATPVVVDVEYDTFNIDPELVNAAVTSRTKAIIAVHLGGAMADVDRLNEICRRHGLLLIEDCAHAH